MSENMDLRINGSGRASGGTYNLVRINGSGTINGDVICKEFSINGSGEATGKVEAGTLRVNGSGHFRADVKATQINVKGSATFEGGVDSPAVVISGSSDVKKDVLAKGVKISGSAKIEGNCSADTFVSDGVFEVGGLLNADHIDIHLYWHISKVKEIGGENISVQIGTNKLSGVLTSIFTLGTQTPHLSAEVIEGNTIRLENTSAKVVRGNNVTIGNNCTIGLVEYKTSYKKTGGSQVDKEVKL